MRQIIPKLAAGATVLLLGSAALVGVAWLRDAIPRGARPDPPFQVPGKPPPIELASIPWKRDPAHPIDVHHPLAIGGLAWEASADRPRAVNLVPTAIPWTSAPPRPVNLTPAVLPWPLMKK